MGAVDFACARCDGRYTDGRHPDATSIASDIVQDLARRDFTCNALARNLETGEIIDPFRGQWAIDERLLRAVGSARARFDEDKLRAFRAVRFAVTKNFRIDGEIWEAINALTLNAFEHVSTERIREELVKAFRVNCGLAFRLLVEDFPLLWEVVNMRGIWFCPTTKR
jgi:tRNA nucleotidyltransferase (CCA-adding enzyme)